MKSSWIQNFITFIMLTAWLCASGHDVLLELVDRDHQHYSVDGHHDHHHHHHHNGDDGSSNDPNDDDHQKGEDTTPEDGKNVVLIVDFNCSSLPLASDLVISHGFSSHSSRENIGFEINSSIDLQIQNPNAPPNYFNRPNPVHYFSLIQNSHSVLPNAPPVFA